MTRLLTLTLFVLIGFLNFGALAEEASKYEKSKWIPLSGGESVAGWTPLLEPVTFESVDGEIRLMSKVNVWVASDLELGDFIFEGEALIPDDASEKFNSGFAFRCVGREKKPTGYQCEIDGANPGFEAGVYAIGMGGWVYPTSDPQKAEHAKRVKSVYKFGQWNAYRIHAVGPRIRTYLNDVLISDVRHTGSLRGYFGIQHHGRDGVMRFRNLRVKSLDPKPNKK